MSYRCKPNFRFDKHNGWLHFNCCNCSSVNNSLGYYICRNAMSWSCYLGRQCKNFYIFYRLRIRDSYRHFTCRHKQVPYYFKSVFTRRQNSLLMFYLHNHGFLHHLSKVLDKSRPMTTNMLGNYFKKFVIPNIGRHSYTLWSESNPHTGLHVWRQVTPVAFAHLIDGGDTVGTVKVY